jgi:PIN domain nuclease of toxin-antitoxin system
MTYILDASAMVALIRREVGWDRVKDFDPIVPLGLCVVQFIR